ncbi:hypothetical protein [Sagittula sp. MA-2]|jgi:hypothetical protein|uniref:hypothetical protein n=1 Tax=Sagittula sp. MA-2 TaxID=3048007 RepID=UPI0024C31441|nr:hypothetical protein [Sagittula sp. MA-2]WHZ37500.1 hypothetical protein QNI11_10870 [Sagittula sp. MA-2]
MTNGVRKRKRSKPVDDFYSTEPDFSACENRNHEVLCRLVWQSIRERGHDWDGFKWAEPLSQAEWAIRAGVSVSTLRRLQKKPPLQFATRGFKEDKVTLLRLGRPDPDAARKAEEKHVANIMAKTFRTVMIKIESEGLPEAEWALVVQRWKVLPRDDYGRIRGMMEEWRGAPQAEVFHHVVTNWPEFMDRVKADLEIAWHLRQENVVVGRADALQGSHELMTAYILRDEDLSQYRRLAKSVKVTDPRTGITRIERKVGRPGRTHNWWTWRKPHLPFLRRFAHIALRMYIENKGLPDAA